MTSVTKRDAQVDLHDPLWYTYGNGIRKAPACVNTWSPAHEGIIFTMRDDYTTTTSPNNSIPRGLCQCGCGQLTSLARQTCRKDGRVKGQPVSYIHGHNSKGVIGKDRPQPLIFADQNIAAIPLVGSRAEGELFALIDIQDLDAIAPFRWFAMYGSSTIYAATTLLPRRREYMHRVIMGTDADGMVVDHVGMNGLDNRRSQLRLATHTQNHANTPPQTKRAATNSRYKGVSFNIAKIKWEARIGSQGSQYPLGAFASEDEAAHAYDDAARRLFGTFARVNFPRHGERGCFDV